MMTPIRNSPFTFRQPSPSDPHLPTALGVHSGGAQLQGPPVVHGVTAEQNHSPSDC